VSSQNASGPRSGSAVKVALTRRWLCEDVLRTSGLRVEAREGGEIATPLLKRPVVEFSADGAGFDPGLGEDLALGADDETRTGIGEVGIAAGAVHADDIGKILDSARAEEGDPVIDPDDGPVRDHDKELSTERGRFTEWLGKAEVVTDERRDLPSIDFENDALFASGVVIGLMGEREGVAFAVAGDFAAIGSEADRFVRSIGRVFVSGGDPGDDVGLSPFRQIGEKLLGFASAGLGDGRGVHREACGGEFRKDDERAGCEVASGKGELDP